MSLKNIKIETTSEVFSAHSGLFLLDKLWHGLNLDRKFKQLVPKKKRRVGIEQVNKFKSIVYSFAVGNDSICDLDVLRDDLLFCKIIGGKTSASATGEFLKSFGRRHLERLQEAIIEAVIELRFALYPEDKKFVLTMDSTPHEHYGKKMEGLAWNYKNYWCLDSQNVYDQYGFSYLFDLRPGSTHSAKEAEKWVHHIYSKVPKGCDRWFRADSAYSKMAMYEALQAADVNFVMCLGELVGTHVRKRNKHLLTWRKTELKFFKSDQCEVAMGLYPIKKYDNLRVVFIRAPKESEEQLKLLDNVEEDGYRYYSLVTNVSAFDMNEEKIIDFYRERSTAETYIKELKNGYDFFHFPCQRLLSNNVWGQAGALAHNLIRALGLMMEQKKKKVRDKRGKLKEVTQLGYFAKRIRNSLIKIAGKVVSSARQVKLRLNNSNWEVYALLMIKIKNVKQRYVRHKTLSEFFNNRIENDQLSYGPPG